MAKQKGICEECKSEYEYEYNPKYPRKYCPACSAAKKAAYESSLKDAPAEVVKPGQQSLSTGQIATTQGISNVEHDFQSEYEFGAAGNRFKIKFRTIEELKAKRKELIDTGLLEEI